MQLRLPASLHYPIAITELLKQVDDDIERFAPLFTYTYETKVTESDELGNVQEVEKTFPTRYQSNVEGKLKSWSIQAGDLIYNARTVIAEIEEPCSHSIQFGGMCGICGKDMREVSYVTEEVDASRATVNMVHNNVSLTISEAEANRVEDEAKRRLLASKKLSLVVDLDQTIIHATVDPTVGDWQKDPDNPNHDAVKNVHSFLLKDDGPGNHGCWYYVKTRPKLEKFLEQVSKLYELHIYTMGTRQYAKHIADVVDPSHKYFGDRILSRDESGSMTAKNLQRLFPVDTKMVVIIDDRADVWKWSPNLIKVVPYDFFVGIGDINSSFLPKKPDLKQLARQASAPVEAETNVEAQPDAGNASENTTKEDDANEQSQPALVDNSASPLDHVVAMQASGDATDRLLQSTQRDEEISAQLEERPLLQQQKKLEAEDAANADANEYVDDDKVESEKSHGSDKPKHNLLQDFDLELVKLENSLRTVHTAYFDAYAQEQAAAQGGRLAQLRGEQKRKVGPSTSDLDLVPDIKVVMPGVKSQVLKGTVIVFSGLIPLGLDVHSTDIAIEAASFGAIIHEEVTKSTTHLIAARNRTQKVRTALRKGKGRIHIVYPTWLLQSLSAWAREKEEKHLVEVGDARPPGLDEQVDIWSDTESLNFPPSEASDIESLDTSSEPLKSSNSMAKSQSKQNLGSDADFDASFPPGTEDFDRDERSPIGGSDEDWNAMNDELKDFLGSEAEDDSDNDDDTDGVSNVSEKSNKSTDLNKKSGKRARDRDSDTSSPGSDGADEMSKPSTRKKQMTSTSLSQSYLPGNGKVQSNGGESATVNDSHDIDEGDGWSDFDDENLEAEIERAYSDVDAEGGSPN